MGANTCISLFTGSPSGHERVGMSSNTNFQILPFDLDLAASGFIGAVNRKLTDLPPGAGISLNLQNSYHNKIEPTKQVITIT